jgi:hypothetical protein
MKMENIDIEATIEKEQILRGHENIFTLALRVRFAYFNRLLDKFTFLLIRVFA